MDAEIDIEEHDVLENPVVKYIFPDISILKQEIQYFDEDSPVKQEPEFTETGSPSFPVHEDFQTNCNVASKAILGVSNLQCSSNPLPDIAIKPRNQYVQPIVQGNKIILGSKPNSTKSDTTKLKKPTNTKTVNVKHPKVILQDIKSYLNNNGRYCTKCCTLFLTKHALYAHNSKVHEQVLSRSTRHDITARTSSSTRFKCVLCAAFFSYNSNLSRHYKNVHKKYMALRKKRNKVDLTVKRAVDNNEPSKKSETIRQNKILSKVQAKDILTTSKISKATTTKQKPKIVSAKEDRLTSSVKKKVSFSKTNLTTKNKKHNDKVLSTEPKVSEHLGISSSKEDIKSEYVTRAKNSMFKDSNVCLHCKKEFPDQKTLIDHMYKILNPKSDQGEQVTENNIEKQDIKRRKKEDDTLYVCRHCSYYLPSIKAYFVHNIKFHKIEVFMEVNKEKFDAQCKYCPSKNINMRAHNTHLYRYHDDLMKLKIINEYDNGKEKENKDTGKSFALESVLFECNKCNVCFLSSNIAQDHKSHMEMLINWKCSICNHILKQQYKETHMKQHILSPQIKIISIKEKSINSVLFKCTKCAIHCSEERYQIHYPKCGIEATDSTYCKICDILVDKSDMTQHEYNHERCKEISDFTIIDSNVIVDDVNTRRKRGSDAEPEGPPRKRLYEQINCLTYCYTCKCYLSDIALKRKVHIQGKCSKIPKYVCNICGLMLTNVAMKTHKQRHKKDKKLILQHYKFYDLKGKLILPPLPEYPHCESCGIHFLTKNAIKSHMCDETDFLTCDLCNINLSETAYKLHMSFHFYFIKDGVTSISSVTNTSTTTSNDTKTRELKVKPEVRSDKKLSKIKSHLKNSVSDLSKTTTQPVKPVDHTLDAPKLLLKPNEPIAKSPIPNNEALQNRHSKKIDHKENKHVEKESVLLLIYTCITCGIMIETYDEVIDHCWTHYNTNKLNTRKKIMAKPASSIYDIKFDRSAYITRFQRNHPHAEVKVMKFDPSYFTRENKFWVEHVFHGLPENVTKEHIDKSIYQHEHRVKFECIQKGLPNFKVYKCDICGNCIDHDSVYMHAKVKCIKVRKHPCTLCGLPFISTLSRNNHEKLHKGKYGRSLKSVSIILFNQIKDQTSKEGVLSSTNQYTLYQCRTCDGIEEKSCRAKHVCDVNTLAKCSKCGLLICKKEYNTHVSKHNDLPNYSSENFKVILFGNNNTEQSDRRKLKSGFSGTVYDYTLYKCQKCETCIKNFQNSEKHACPVHFDLERSLCSQCNLYFPSLKLHMRLHNTDPDFVRENMNVIIFDGSKKQHEELTVKKEDSEISSKNKKLSENCNDNTDNAANSNVNNENELDDYSTQMKKHEDFFTKIRNTNEISTTNNENEIDSGINSIEFLKESRLNNAKDIKERNCKGAYTKKNVEDEKGNNDLDRDKNITENVCNDESVPIMGNFIVDVSLKSTINGKEKTVNNENIIKSSRSEKSNSKQNKNKSVVASSETSKSIEKSIENNSIDIKDRNCGDNTNEMSRTKKNNELKEGESASNEYAINLFEYNVTKNVCNNDDTDTDKTYNMSNISIKDPMIDVRKHNENKDNTNIENREEDNYKNMCLNNDTGKACNDDNAIIVENCKPNLFQDDANNTDDANNRDSDGKVKNKSENDSKEKEVDPVILFKCKCGLHFLNKPNIIEHLLKKCQPKSKLYKQNCSKCDYLFNPSELFSHLLIHHRDKTRVQKFTVVEFSDDAK